MKRQVELRMLKIDWVFRDSESGYSRGFADLIDGLVNAPNESLFGTDMVNTLMSSFWKDY